MNQAMTELEMFSRSRSVVFSGTTPVEVPGPRQQQIKQITTEQQQSFKQAMDDLRKIADEPVENNRQARNGFRVKTLMSAMLVYQANWVLDDLGLFDSRMIDLKEKTRLVLIKLEQLKSEQTMELPANYAPPIELSQSQIAKLKESHKKISGQLEKMNNVIAKITGMLDDAVKRRDALNIKVGDLTEKLNIVPAAEAVKLQKMIGDLERERFKVLIEIEKLTAGPMELPAELQVQLDNQQLKEISGLKQLDQEKNLLETQLKSTQEGIDAQEAYLKSLQEQVRISEQKGRELAQRMDNLTARLKDDLKDLDELAAKRDDLARKAKTEAQSAEKYAKQANDDLKRYISAVSQAKSQLSPGRDDSVLNSTEGLETLEFTIGNFLMSAQLDKAKVDAASIKFIQTLAPILKRSQPFMTLPQNLEKFFQEASTNEKTLLDELAKILDQTIRQYEAVNNKAARGNFKTVVGTSLALALNKAAALLPQKSSEYLTKAKEVLDKIAPAGATVESDQSLVPAKQLRQELGL